MKKQLKLKSGITLIALVITIIILIILAGVSISILSGENGLINKAIQAKERQEYSNYSDRLQLVVHNTYLNTQSKEIDTYIADIKKDEMLKDARIDKEDDITAYITLDNKYVFTLQVARSGQINLEYNGIAGKLLPKVIRLSIINVKSNSITVNTEALRTDSYKYYIKNPTTGEYDYKGENKTGTFEYTELAQGITLELKVVAINENGEDYKTITEITRTMPTGTITIGNAQWHNNTHKATVTVSSTNTNYQLQYSTDQTTWLPINSGDETEEQPNNTTIYARLFDGTNAPDEEYVHYTIEDNIAPTAPTLTVTGNPAQTSAGWYTEDVVVKVTDGTDADSGVDKTTYILTGATTKEETEIENNGTITISNNGTTIITAYTYDGAENKSAAATMTINKDSTGPTAPALTVTGSPTKDSTNWYTSNVAVQVTAGADSDSNIARTTYTLTGSTTKAETEIANNGTITISNNGTTTITAYTYNGAGNRSTAATMTINKDAGTPTYNDVSGQSASKASHAHSSSCNSTCSGRHYYYYWNGDYDDSGYCDVRMRCNVCKSESWQRVHGYYIKDCYNGEISFPCTNTVQSCNKSPVTATVKLQKATNMARTRARVTISNGSIGTVTWSGDYTKLSNTEVIVNSGTVSCSVSYTAGTSSSTGTTSGSASFSVTK